MKKIIGVVFLMFFIGAEILGLEFSIGFSGSSLNAPVYLTKYTSSNGYDFENILLQPFEIINYTRLALSFDTKFLWLESGLSITGGNAQSLISAFAGNVNEYGFFISGYFKIPAKYGIFTFFPLLGFEWTHLLVMTADGENVTDQMSAVLKRHLNHRFSYKVGFGVDVDVSKKIYARLWGTMGMMGVDPEMEYSQSVEPILDLTPELQDCYIDSISYPTTLGLMIGYRFR